MCVYTKLKHLVRFEREREREREREKERERERERERKKTRTRYVAYFVILIKLY